MRGWLLFTSVDDFAADSTFRSWVASGAFGQQGHPFTEFLSDHTHLIPLAQQAADLLRVTSFSDDALTADELNAQIGATWEKIRFKEEVGGISRNPIRHVWARWAAAAAILLIGGLTWLEYQKPEVQSPVSESALPSRPEWRVFTNKEANVRPLSLPDGSVVWLESGSSLRFPDVFDTDKREVVLTGEAFFEIFKNPRQPFFAKTRDLVTRVVGTSFSIRAPENNTGTVVQVRTGEVLVYRVKTEKLAEEPVTLQANQQLFVSGGSEQLLTEPVKQQSVLSERLNEHHFEFTDVPISVVLDALSKAYGLSVEYNEAAFRNCHITTALTDEPLTEKLHILAETTGPGTRVELVDNKIRLTGAGCPQYTCKPLLL